MENTLELVKMLKFEMVIQEINLILASMAWLFMSYCILNSGPHAGMAETTNESIFPTQICYFSLQ